MENENTSTPTYQEVFKTTLTGAGYTEVDGHFEITRDVVVGEMVVNGKPIRQKQQIKTVVTLLGEGEVTGGDTASKIIGINITEGPADYGDFWTPEEDFENDLKKILRIK